MDPETDFFVIPVIMVVVWLAIAGGCILCQYLYYANADEESQARMRMAAEGTIPVVVTVQHRGEAGPGEAASLLGDQNRDTPTHYNTMAVGAVVNEIQSKKKRKTLTRNQRTSCLLDLTEIQSPPAYQK